MLLKFELANNELKYLSKRKILEDRERSTEQASELTSHPKEEPNLSQAALRHR